jgi:hypothetical protein
MRQRLDNPRSWYAQFATYVQLEQMKWIPADNAVWDMDFPPYVELNPAGAVDILLPAQTLQDAGKMWLVSNISASTVTFKSAGDAAFTTAIVLATLENTFIFSTGSATAAIGWRAIGTALST